MRRRPVELAIEGLVLAVRHLGLVLERVDLVQLGNMILLECLVLAVVLRPAQVVPAISSRLKPGEVTVEHHEVVGLLGELLQAVVLRKETQQLRRGSVVRQLVRSHVLVSQHQLKNLFAMATSLHTLVNVEIENTQWFYLLDVAMPVLKESSPSCFQETDH